MKSKQILKSNKIKSKFTKQQKYHEQFGTAIYKRQAISSLAISENKQQAVDINGFALLEETISQFSLNNFTTHVPTVNTASVSLLRNIGAVPKSEAIFIIMLLLVQYFLVGVTAAQQDNQAGTTVSNKGANKAKDTVENVWSNPTHISFSSTGIGAESVINLYPEDSVTLKERFRTAYNGIKDKVIDDTISKKNYQLRTQILAQFKSENIINLIKYLSKPIVKKAIDVAPESFFVTKNSQMLFARMKQVALEYIQKYHPEHIETFIAYIKDKKRLTTTTTRQAVAKWSNNPIASWVLIDNLIAEKNVASALPYLNK